MKRKLLHTLFLSLIFVITLWTIFHGKNLDEVFNCLSSANPLYVLISIFCVILFILGEAVIINYLMHALDSKVKFSHCCLYSFIGFFYSAITPSASGGQPMQIIAMRKDNIPAAVSTVVLAIVTVMYKLVLVFFGLFILIVQPGNIMNYLNPVLSIVYLGLILNIMFIVILLMLVFRPNTLRWLSIKTLSLINKIRPLKNFDKKLEKLEHTMNQYEGTADFFKKNQKIIFNVFLLTILQRFILFFITWLTYKSFSLSGYGIPIIVSLQAMISVAVDMLPVPGGMVASENIFLEIFNPIFGTSLVLPGMIISRGISYYTQFAISAVMTVVASFIITGKNLTSEKNVKNNLKGVE